MGSTQRWVRCNRKQYDGEAPLVGIVLTTRNRRTSTLDCLDSVYALDYPSAILTVVDNGSDDMTAETIRERFPEVQVIRNQRDLGTARGFNQGIRWSFSQGADYVLLLKCDKTPDSHMLSRLVDAAEMYPDAGILAPRIADADDPASTWFTGYRFTSNERDENSPPPDPTDDADLVQSSCPAAVDYVSDDAMLITQDLYDKLGGFCERYDDFYADVAYCIQARRQSFQVMYIPHAAVLHHDEEPKDRSTLRRTHLRQLQGRMTLDHRTSRGIPLVARWCQCLLGMVLTWITAGGLLPRASRKPLDRAPIQRASNAANRTDAKH